MTAWFQGILGTGLGWFVATLILILMIALVAMALEDEDFAHSGTRIPVRLAVRGTA